MLPLAPRSRAALMVALAACVVAAVWWGFSPHAGDPPPSAAAGTTTKVVLTPTPSPSASSTPSAEPVAAASAPSLSLAIPAIGLQAPVEEQGLRDGLINPDQGQVIWFSGYDRVAPGALGTAVLAGHVASASGDDIFADLHKVTKGEQVVLTSPAGETKAFVVTETFAMQKDALAYEGRVWGHNTSVARLVLVTCDDSSGVLADGHRAANFVVIAEQA